MRAARRRIDVNLEELDRVLDGALQAPLSEADHDKLKEALHALAAMLARPRNTEKASAVLETPEDSETSDGTQPDDNTPPPPGHGRNPLSVGGLATTRQTGSFPSSRQSGTAHRYTMAFQYMSVG